MKNKITVLDSIMGSGKTTWAINKMQKGGPYLFISPFKSEDERVNAAIPSFYVPKDIEGVPKLPRLKTQLRKHKNVASTHSLFKLFDEECIRLVQEGNYTLILDEVLDVVMDLGVNKSDIQMILDSGAVTTNNNYGLMWTGKYNNLSEKGFGWLENMVKMDKVINVDDAALFWQFPPSIFSAFREVYVLTYLFNSSMLSRYFAINNLAYTIKSIKDGEICDYYKPRLNLPITIYDGKYNTNIPTTETTFSKTWYLKPENKVYVDRMANNLYNFFNNKTRAKTNEKMWTCFNDDRCALKGRGYSRNFVPCNARSTNAYKDVKVMAYCINRYLNPYIKKYFCYLEHPMLEDEWGLSEMVQWIWRSRIREGKAITIYIPSPRMRNLLCDWLTLLKH